MGVIKKVKLELTARARMERFQKDLARMEKLIVRAESRTIRVPVRLDTSKIRAEIQRAGAELKAELAKAQAGNVSQGGIALPNALNPKTLKNLSASGKSIRSEIQNVTNLASGRPISRTTTDVEQLEAGLQRTTKTLERYKAGAFKAATATEKISDTRELTKFTDGLGGIQKRFSKELPDAIKTGDTGRQVKLLQAQAKDLDAALADAGAQRFSGTKDYQNAANQVGRLHERVARLQATEAKRAEKLKSNARLDKFRGDVSKKVNAESAELGKAKGLRNTAEQARILQKRMEGVRGVLKSTKDPDLISSRSFKAAEHRLDRLGEQLSRIQGAKTRSGTSRDLNRRIAGQERLAQASLKSNLVEQERARSIRTSSARETRLTELRAARSRILADSEGKFLEIRKEAQKLDRPDIADKAQRRANGARNATNQNDLENVRRVERGAQRARETSLNRRLRNIREITAAKIRTNNVDTQAAKQIKSRQAREQRLNQLLKERVALLTRSASLSGRVGSTAKREGFSGTSSQATSQQRKLGGQLIETQNKVAKSTRNSGHALNFHTSSLARNALTFAKWQSSAFVVLSTVQALNAGIKRSIEVQRSFAILQAVFQGSRQEAQLLKEDVLDLATANGRSADEAVDSAIRYSRLGFTRAQANLAVETSLRAANVAEVEAGEATEKLISIYKAFNLQVAEIPGTLDRLNALSNRYAVTVKDLFEGISRTGAIARQAGLDLQDLEGIITSVVASTGRPGAEVGNAIKFITTRLRRPETLNKLEEAFDIDLRNASGEIKTMSEILDQLAAIYPRLTRTQQAFFLDIGAGSRQANRFALILENYREAQIATTRALADQNSAARENAEITKSLSSLIEGLKTEWTDLFTAMGDAGAYELAAQGLRLVKGEVEGFSDIMATLRGESDLIQEDTQIVVKDQRAAKGLRRTSLNPFAKLFTKFNPEEVDNRIKELKAAIKIAERGGVSEKAKSAVNAAKTLTNKIPSFVNPTSNQFITGLISKAGKEGQAQADDLVKPTELLLKELEALLQAQEKFADSQNNAELVKQGESLEQVGKKVASLRREVDLYAAAEKAVLGLADDLLLPDADASKIAKQFGDLRDPIQELPNGYKIAADAAIEFDKAIEGHNLAKAREVLLGLSDEFANFQPDSLKALATAAATAEEDILSRLESTRSQISHINTSITEAQGKGEQQRLAKQLSTEEEKAQNLAEALRHVRGALNDLEKPFDGLSDAVDRTLGQFRDNFEIVSKALSEGLSSLTIPTADNADRTQARTLRSEEIKLRFLEAQAEATARRTINNKELLALEKELQQTFATVPGAAPIATARLREIEKEIALNDDLVEQSNLVVKKEKERLETIRIRLQAERDAARLSESFNTGKKSSENAAAALNFGRNVAEKLINQSRGLENLGTPDPDSTGPGATGTETAREMGRLLQIEGQMRSNLESLETRRFSITAARRQAEIDLTSELRKQGQEASRNLAFADRENQLRAAATKAAVSRSGSITRQEFNSLSQATRQNVSSFTPDLLPTGLNKTVTDFQENARLLNNEERLIVTSLARLRSGLDRFSEQNEILLENSFRDTDLGLNPLPLQDVANLRNPQVNVALSVGSIPIQISLAKEIEGLSQTLEAGLSARFSAEMREIRELIPTGPDNTPANGVSF